MMKGLKKAAVIGLSACLALGSLSGCSKKDTLDVSAAAATVNGDEISAGLVKFSAHYTQSQLENMYKMYMGVSDPMSSDLYGNGSTLGSMVRTESVNLLENMVLAEQKMSEYDVELTDEEKKLAADTAAQFLNDNGEEVLEQMGATQEVVERYLTLRLIQSKMEKVMPRDIDTEVSDEEAAQRKVQYAYFRAETEAETEEETGTEAESASEAESESTAADEKETEAKTEGETAVETEADTEAETAALTEAESVKTKAAAETESESGMTEAQSESETAADAEAESDSEAEADVTEEGTEAAETETETETEDPAMVEAKEKAKAKAEAMIAKLKSGEDFETAADEVDPDASTNTTTFGSDSTVIADGLITATEGLDDDTLVEEPIESDNGYYVAKVISKLDREATDEKKEDILEDRKSDRISELYQEWKDASEITENEDVIEKITFDFSLEPETEEETEASTETESESAAETEPETVAESETAAESETESEAAEESETATDAESETAAETESAAETEK